MGLPYILQSDKQSHRLKFGIRNKGILRAQAVRAIGWVVADQLQFASSPWNVA